MSISVELLKISAMLIIGIVTGMVLCASGFCDSKKNSSAAKLEDNALILTLLYAIFFGVILVQIARLAGIPLPAVKLPGVGICAVGGVLCGAGYAVAKCGVFSGITGIGAGKLYFIWTAAGMVLALWVIEYFKSRVPQLFECRFDRERVFCGTGSEIFVYSNPALYVLCGVAALIIVTSFLKRK